MPEPLPPGTLVEKINSRPGDAHQDGARATVLRHFGQLTQRMMDVPAGTYGYYVMWHDIPGLPVFVTGNRIRRVGS